MPCLNKVQKKYTKEKLETDKRRKHFFHTFLYLLGEWTNQRYVPRSNVVPKTPDSKMMLLVWRTLLTRLGSQKTWVFISLHRLQIRHSKILLILARPLPIGYFTCYYFSFFLIFNWMHAWSLMRGDAFIHFVCGSRRVNIRLRVLLLIPNSPQYIATRNSGATRRILREKWIFVRVSRLSLIFFYVCSALRFFFFFCKKTELIFNCPIF